MNRPTSYIIGFYYYIWFIINYLICSKNPFLDNYLYIEAQEFLYPVLKLRESFVLKNSIGSFLNISKSYY